CFIVPGAAADGVRIRLGGLVPRVDDWTGSGTLLVIIGIILIQDPLNDIAVDVVEAPGIWLLFANLLIFKVAILLEPGVFRQLAGIIPEEINRGGTGTTCVLPLRLGRQTIELAGFGTQPLAILIRRMLRHADGGKTILAHAKAHFHIRFGGM